MKYDYAVLELRKPQRQSFLKPVTYHGSRPVLLFNGFPSDKKPNTMWHTPCAILRKLGGYLMTNCHLPKGMSGAGGYQSVGKGSYVVKGIVVAAVSVRTRDRKTVKFNVVNPLTRAKTRLICKWIKAGSYCKSFPRQSQLKQIQYRRASNTADNACQYTHVTAKINQTLYQTLN